MKPVSKTAYYCCAVRALDAGTSRPECGDHLAQRFMTPEAWALFEPFRDLGTPNASNVVRHRMIDDRLRAAIALAAAERGRERTSADEDDVIDPFRLSEEVYADSFAQITSAVEVIVGVLMRS